MVHETQQRFPNPFPLPTSLDAGPNVTFTNVDGAYVVVTYINVILSIFGNVTIVGCYYLYSEIRTTGRKLFACLSIANFILCIGIILQTATFYRSMDSPLPERGFLCETAALFATYANTATFLWTDAIGFYLFLCVTLRYIVVANRITWLFHIFSWAMPAVIALSGGITDVYGYDDTYLRSQRRPAPCWISDRVSNKLDWHFVTIEGWALASYCACVLLYIVITISVRFQNAKTIDRNYVIEDMAIETANHQLRYVPLIFILLRMWGTIHFLNGHFSSAKVREVTGDWLLMFKALGDSSIGWVNCLLFLMTVKPLRRRISKWFRDRCKGKVKVPDKWRPSVIVRHMKKKKVPNLELSDIHLNFPDNDDSSSIIDDDIIFEREGVKI